MTTTAELREALDLYDELVGDDVFRPAIDAARTIALPILEADSELVERIANVIYVGRFGGFPMANVHEDYRKVARAVLTAISTPTPGAE